MTEAGRCRKCFAALNAGAKFCPSCGEPVAQAAFAGVAGPQGVAATPAAAANEDPWAPPPGPAPRAYAYPGQPLCPRCQTPRQFGSSQCLRCGMPFASTSGIPATVEGLGRPAGFWIRFAAYIIDYVIVWIASFILIFVIGLVSAGSLVAGGEEAAVGVFLIGYLAVLIALLAYYVVPVAHWGATPGKKLLNIYVVDANGRRGIGYPRAIGRALGMIVSALILYIGFIMAGFREDKRALHDLIAGTYPTVIIGR